MKTLKDLKKWANELKKEGNSLGDTLEEYIEGWENDLQQKKINNVQDEPYNKAREKLVDSLSKQIVDHNTEKENKDMALKYCFQELNNSFDRNLFYKYLNRSSSSNNDSQLINDAFKFKEAIARNCAILEGEMLESNEIYELARDEVKKYIVRDINKSYYGNNTIPKEDTPNCDKKFNQFLVEHYNNFCNIYHKPERCLQDINFDNLNTEFFLEEYASEQLEICPDFDVDISLALSNIESSYRNMSLENLFDKWDEVQSNYSDWIMEQEQNLNMGYAPR